MFTWVGNVLWQGRFSSYKGQCHKPKRWTEQKYLQLSNIYFHIDRSCFVAGQVFWIQKEVALSSKHMSQGTSRNLVTYHSMKGVFIL